MNSPASTMTEADTPLVITSCENYLQMRAQFHAEVKQQFIENSMKPRTYLFGLIRISGMTQPQAEHAWQHGQGGIPPQLDLELHCLLEYRDVCNLLQLARNTTQPTMWLNSDISYILKWQKITLDS